MRNSIFAKISNAFSILFCGALTLDGVLTIIIPLAGYIFGEKTVYDLKALSPLTLLTFAPPPSALIGFYFL